MKRREFLKSMTALAAGGVLPAAPAVWSPAKAQARQETLAHRVRERAQQYRHPRRRHQRAGLRGVVELLRPAHQPRDEDAAERHAILRSRQVQDGARRRHERRRHVGHLQAEEERGLPRRHAGHRQGRQVVARPRRHRRRLPHLPDGRRLADQARAVRGGRRQHGPRRFPAQGPPHGARSRGDRARGLQFGAGQEARHRKGSLGSRIHQAEHRRQRRLSGRELERRHRGHSRAQRQVDGRAAAEGQAHRLAHGAVRRQPARAARARRRRHFLRPAEQGFRRAQEHRQAQHRVDAVLQRHPIHRHEREDAALRQSEGAPGRRLRHSVPEDHGRGAVRSRQADVRRGEPTRRPRSRGRSRTSSTPTSPRPRR